MTLQRILHPTDFSPSAFRALELAAGLAQSHHAALDLLYADVLRGEPPADADDELEAYVERARSLLGDGRGDTRPPLKVIRERSVRAFDAIMTTATARPPDLIVMGTRGQSTFHALLMGSTAEKVVRHAPCPVLTTRADAAQPAHGTFRKILVPVDFSESSRNALDGARAIWTDDTTIYLAHIVEPIPPMYYAGNMSSPFEIDPDLHDRIEQMLREMAGDFPGIEIRIGEGNAAAEITRLAAADVLGADLIVMSTKGLSGLEHWLLGSVTERVCRHAPAPVLTMR